MYKRIVSGMLLILLLIGMLTLALDIERARANTNTIYRGLSWYGLDTANFDSWNLNQAGFDQMYSRYPNMSVLVLPILLGCSSAELNRLDDFLGWCEADGIKVIISNYWETFNLNAITSWWETIATRYDGNTTVYAFDLINEPWRLKNSPELYQNTLLPRYYESIIDAVRAIDPNRKCMIQSYLKNWEGFDWIRTNPVDRTNIAYITHIYSHEWVSGDWKTSSYVYPWVDDYPCGDYTTGYSDLHDEMWNDFGYVVNDLGLEFWCTEMPTRDDPHSRQYWSDLVEILEDIGVSWCWHSYYSVENRPLTLTFPSGAERGTADLCRSKMEYSGKLEDEVDWEDDFESGTLSEWDMAYYSRASDYDLMEDFSDGSYNGWTGRVSDDGQVSADSTYDVSGGFSFRMHGINQKDEWATSSQIIPDATTYYMLLYFRVNATPATGQLIHLSPYLRDHDTNNKKSGSIFLLNFGGTQKVGVRYDTTSGTQFYNVTQAFSADTWYHVQLRVTHHASAGIVALWWNGNQIISRTELSNNYVMDRAYLQCAECNTGSDWTVDVWYDYIIIDTAYISDPAHFITVTSSKKYLGPYAANITFQPACTWTHFVHEIPSESEIWMRCYVQFEDLPDTSDSRFNFLTTRESDGTLIASAIIYRNATDHYHWGFRNNGLPQQQTYDASLTSDVWYCVEIYLKLGASGNSTIWVDGTQTFSWTGDLSSLGNICYVGCQGAVGTGQATSKSIYFDNFAVDNERIGA